MNIADCLDKTIFSVFLDADGNKLIHFWGYGYYMGDGYNTENSKPYRFLEYTFFIAPLSDVLKEGFSNYESEYSDQFKQYITDCNEKELIDCYKNYGLDIKEIDELTTNTECGCYIW